MEELFIDLSFVGIYLFVMVLTGLFESKTAINGREFMGEIRLIGLFFNAHVRNRNSKRPSCSNRGSMLFCRLLRHIVSV